MTAHITGGRPAGVLAAPPSKSMAHRMLVCAALARGGSRIQNLGRSQDILATVGALRALGADITLRGSCALVRGADMCGARESAAAERRVHCGESGSTLRFVLPLFSLGGARAVFTGEGRLLSRPLASYADIYRARGLRFEADENRVVTEGALTAGRYTLAGNVSSQFVSGLLFALPLLGGDSEIELTTRLESRSYAELTRAAQALFGVHSRRRGSRALCVAGGQSYTAGSFAVEGDWSQAAFPAVIAAVRGGVDISGLSPRSPQPDRAILAILRRAGAGVSWRGGSLRVRPGVSPLVSPGDVDVSDCPDLGPVLCVLGLFCRGGIRLVNAGRLRLKESDRIACMEAELAKLGARVESGADFISVCAAAPRGGAAVSSHGDHRVAMALAAAAVCGGTEMRIEGAEAVSKSWPEFFGDMRGLGVAVSCGEAETYAAGESPI